MIFMPNNTDLQSLEFWSNLLVNQLTAQPKKPTVVGFLQYKVLS